MLEYWRPMDQQEERKNPNFVRGGEGAPKLFFLQIKMRVVKKPRSVRFRGFRDREEKPSSSISTL